MNESKINWRQFAKALIIILIIIILFLSIGKVNQIQNFSNILITISLALFAISITLLIYVYKKKFRDKQQLIIKNQWNEILPQVEKLIKNIKTDLKNNKPSFKERKKHRKSIADLIEKSDLFEGNLDCQQFLWATTILFFITPILAFVDFVIKIQLIPYGIISIAYLSFWIGIIFLVNFLFALYDIESKN